jgi:transcriptional regulator with XRE-family HTH domain
MIPTLDLAGSGERVNVCVMDAEPAPPRHRPLLGARLREARIAADVSQAQLAIRTGIAAPAISRIENGHESPSYERFSICMNALGFEPHLELRALSGSRADPRHLAEEVALSPSERLERLFAWMRFGDQLARAEVHSLAPRGDG